MAAPITETITIDGPSETSCARGELRRVWPPDDFPDSVAARFSPERRGVEPLGVVTRRLVWPGVEREPLGVARVIPEPAARLGPDREAGAAAWTFSPQDLQ